MTTLRDLTGPWPMSLPTEVGYADRVPEFSMGGNDKYNDCVFPDLAHLHETVTAVNGRPEVMDEASCEYFYAVETGFDPGNRSTDKGAVLFQVIEHWCANGWPGDPMLKPTGWCDVIADEIPIAIHMLGGVVGWAMLPPDGAGGYDFDGTDKPGEYAHAVFIAGATWNSLTLISWARSYTVPMEWARKYIKEVFGIRHPAWEIPRETVA